MPIKLRPARSAFAIAVLLLGTDGCHRVNNQFTFTEKTIQTSRLRPDRPLNVLPDSIHQLWCDLNHVELVKSFYSSRNNTAAWMSRDGRLPQADSMIRCIEMAPLYGLSPLQYHAEELAMLAMTPVTMEDTLTDRRMDVLLTDAFFSMAADLGGKRKAGLIYNSKRMNDLLVARLQDALTSGDALSGVIESYDSHNLSYRELRTWLDLWYSAHEAMVPGTEAADTLRNVIINMQQWRNERDTMPDRYILVNIPSFLLRVFECGKVVLESKVIVGKPETPTPCVSGIIRTIVFHPSWTVPYSISIREILPHLKSDSTYLASNHYEVFDRYGNRLDPNLISWEEYHESFFPFVIRQSQGPYNALGVIKFVFANPYDIYLHDTNVPALFRQNLRDLSHGCIRVEKARELAHYLLGNDSTYGTPDACQYLEIDQRVEVRLTEPIPVYVRYFTCEVQEGKLLIYTDLYSKQQEENSAQ